MTSYLWLVIVTIGKGERSWPRSGAQYLRRWCWRWGGFLFAIIECDRLVKWHLVLGRIAFNYNLLRVELIVVHHQYCIIKIVFRVQLKLLRYLRLWMPSLLFSESLLAKCLLYHPGKLTELSFHVHHPRFGLLSVCRARRVRVAAVVVRRRWRESLNNMVQLLLKSDEIIPRPSICMEGTCRTMKWRILNWLEFMLKIKLQYTVLLRIPGVGYVMVG